MAKKKNDTGKKPRKYPQGTIVVNQMTHVAPDRGRKDTGTLRQSVEAAERVHLPNRSRLYDLYHDVLTIDGHLSGITGKRTAAVTNKELRFVDAGGAKVDALDPLIRGAKFERLVELIMESRYWGVSGVEFLVGREFDFLEIPRKHIRPEARQITRSQYDMEGTPLDDLPWCRLFGRPDDLGLFLRCSMYALYKRSGFGDFAQYVEIFGQPVRVIRYDAYDKKTQEELRRMADSAGASLVMMLPKQAEFEMLDGKSSNGTGELQERLISCCNQEMSIAILGNSETTVSSASSGYAQAEVHADQQFEVTKGDLRFVQNALNEPGLLAILASYGYPVEGGRFEFVPEADLGKLNKRLAIDLKVAERVPVADDYWYETYGIPKPRNYEELKRQREEERQAMQGGQPSTPPRRKLLDGFFGKAPAGGARK